MEQAAKRDVPTYFMVDLQLPVLVSPKCQLSLCLPQTAFFLTRKKKKTNFVLWGTYATYDVPNPLKYFCPLLCKNNRPSSEPFFCSVQLSQQEAAFSYQSLSQPDIFNVQKEYTYSSQTPKYMQGKTPLLQTISVLL